MTRPAEFSHRTRARNLETLDRERFDLLVIGGGITGAGVARAAALRGLRVALVERRDFAAGTSSRSSKLIHGGLRYLQQGDVGLVREAATERQVLRRLAPHLVRPRWIVVPAASRMGYTKLRVGLWTFDRLAGIGDAERHRMLGVEETLAEEPLLKRSRLHGAGLYTEYVADDARLVIEVIKSAAALGAVIANYAAVTELVRDGGRIAGAVVEDRLSGARYVVRARVVVNAAGPWVDAVRLLAGPEEQPRLHLTKGIHIGLRHERLPLRRIVIMTAPDRRMVFAIPRGRITYLGTTDTDYPHPDDEPAITLEDVEYLLETANRTFEIEPLAASDVVSAWAGLRPLLHEEGKKPSEISRKDELMVSPSGLVSIAGGKLTTFRRMADRVLQVVVEQLRRQGIEVPPGERGSDALPLSGGDFEGELRAYSAHLQARWKELSPALVERLVRCYGRTAARLAEAMSADPMLRDPCAPESRITRAEVAYAVREEMALTVQDFLERRSRLLLYDPANGLDVVESVAALMGDLLGWDRRRVEAEVAAYRAHVAELRPFQQAEGVGAEPARAAHA